MWFERSKDRTFECSNNQMFEVTVPDGVRPGQPFALIANGQRVMVTCPPDVGPHPVRLLVFEAVRTSVEA